MKRSTFTKLSVRFVDVFGTEIIDIVGDLDDPWFCVADVERIVGAKVPEYGRRRVIDGDDFTDSEGVYAAILRSDKPNCIAFTRHAIANSFTNIFSLVSRTIDVEAKKKKRKSGVEKNRRPKRRLKATDQLADLLRTMTI